MTVDKMESLMVWLMADQLDIPKAVMTVAWRDMKTDERLVEQMVGNWDWKRDTLRVAPLET